MLWDVEIKARAVHIAQIEAETEDDAFRIAEEKGFERSDWYELQDFNVIGVSRG